MFGQLDGLVDHHADEIGPPRLAGPLRCDESDRRPLTSKQTEKTRDECLRREAPWVLSREGELKGIDGLCLWIGPPRNEAGELSVEASREEVDCVSTPLPIGLTKELRMELEIRGVLPPPTEQVGSSVLDPGTVECSKCDAVRVGHAPQAMGHRGEES